MIQFECLRPSLFLLHQAKKFRKSWYRWLQTMHVKTTEIETERRQKMGMGKTTLHIFIFSNIWPRRPFGGHRDTSVLQMPLPLDCHYGQKYYGGRG